MKRLHKAALLLTLLALLLGLCACGSKTPEVTIRNDLGWDIEAIYLNESSESSWGDNLLSEPLADGASITVALPGEGKMDLGIVDNDQDTFEFYDISLSGGETVAIDWDDDPIATVEPKKGDVIVYTGYFLADFYDGEIPDDTEETDALSFPSADVELTEAVPLPDNTDVTISYPAELAPSEDSGNNAVHFSMPGADGSDETLAVISICARDASAYDKKMTEGFETAQKQLQAMLDELLKEDYDGLELEILDSSCTDEDTYYRYLVQIQATGMWSTEQAVRGTIDIRYVGPTGYALYTVALAAEAPYDNCTALAEKMADAITYPDSDWTTAPKEKPSTAKESSAGGALSDTGDYGDTYYWYDSDGDVWYWNGSEDIFIGYGDSYYIDDDGSLYENNDAGWDDDYYDDDYYEANDYGWGDDYYNEWSDPGDYYDDYDW